MELLPLNAGPLSMVFDPQLGFVRHIRLGEIEVVRGIFAAIRDQDWNTIPFAVHDLHLDQSQDRFELSFTGRCNQDPVRFDWRGRITGSQQGSVTFHFAGEARNTFLKNRIGLCVLHPIEGCAGQTCRVQHWDGRETVGAFPKWISPHQPFKNIRSITHPVRDGFEVKVEFTGDVFEMEDQRNWTDASFKTYSTPLDLPFPVQIAAGSSVEQTVIVSVQGEPPDRKPAGTAQKPFQAAPRVQVNWQLLRRLPPIGFGMSTEPGLPSPAALDQLRAIRPRHLRVDLDLGVPSWTDELQQVATLAKRIDCQLEVALFVEQPAAEHLSRHLANFSSLDKRIARWLVFDPTAKATPAPLTAGASQALRGLNAAVPIAVGTNAYFAELNRNRPELQDGMLVCYSINPQVHAFDNLSLRETLVAHRWTVDSARQMFNSQVVISPVTLRPRFNPNATSHAAGQQAKPQTDTRQGTGFAAAWTIGALSQLASHPHVASVTFYETYGPRGVMDASGSPYPVASVFAECLRAERVAAATTSHPLDIAALALVRTDGSRLLLLANLTELEQTLVIESENASATRWTLEPESVRTVTAEEGI